MVYAPIAHWVWGGGWLAKMGALDFAGGTVVHVNAGVAALVAAIVVGKRQEYPSSSLLPHNVPFTLLGAGLLWFGWFGFNAGSALAANGIAALAFIDDDAGAGRDAGGVDVPRRVPVAQADGRRRGDGHRRRPRRGHAGGRLHQPDERHALGAHRGRAELPRADLRAKTSLDDSLDVVAAHGVGGTVGALLTGVFAQKSLNGVADGVLFGNPGQLRDPGRRRLAAHRLQRHHDLRPAEAHRPRVAAARDADDEIAASTSRSTARKPTCTPRC